MKSAIDTLIKQADANLLKDTTKLVHRVERILVPSSSLVYSSIGTKISIFLNNLNQRKYFYDVTELSHSDILKASGKSSENVTRRIDWNLFVKDLTNIIGEDDPTYVLPKEALDEIERERADFEITLSKAVKKEKIKLMQLKNDQPVMPGKWRKEPFTRRVYHPIQNYCVTETIDICEGEKLLSQLETPLNGYLGQAYNYDDHGLTEDWMMTFRDKKSSGPSNNDVIRTQLISLMEIMIGQVQDRVCNEENILERLPLVAGKDVIEVPVWGIDCFTRKMIEVAIEERLKAKTYSAFFAKEFIEKFLLPTINKQSPDAAHDMSRSLNAIIEDPAANERNKLYAEYVLDSIHAYGSDLYKIHPKGTGVICINPNGISAHVLLAEYLGELYPPYRWCEKLDVVEQAQQAFQLKPTLPDFYNILLERPRQDPDGYGLLFVDASQKANIGSSCSHSCEANITSAVVARNGKLTIAMTTNRYIHPGEELTMDYYSITTSDVEWRAAICLCGINSCRGSFLHYATQDDLQQVLNQNCGPLWRYASLLRACSSLPPTVHDFAALDRHGIKKSVLGLSPPHWMIKYMSDALRFVEYERKALPCALLRSKDGSPSQYTFSSADMDARCVMEQRMQSLVCCCSMVLKVLSNQSDPSSVNARPLKMHSSNEVLSEIWDRICCIPILLQSNLLQPPTRSDKSDGGLKLPTSHDTVLKSIEYISELLSCCPTSMSKLREVCLDIRNKLQPIEPFGTSTARISQLRDILVLWAYTTNFSFAQEFAPVQSAPISVVARELGTNIPRAKINKQDKSKRRTRVQDHGKQSSESPTESFPSLKQEQAGVLSSALSAEEVETELNDSRIQDSEIQHKHTDDIKSAAIKGKDILEPNEEVYVASKVYSSLFCFWQLMGWFHAGTDEKVGQPDLFGCVLIPSPACCFGKADLPYEQKQRDLLLSVLKDEKLQTMPWPKELKGTFTPLSTSRKSLYGSPMLDIALGKVDAVEKVLKELRTQSNGTNINGTTVHDKSSSGNTKSKSSKKMKLDTTQYDSILPPEQPTSWVQCEQCKKWRRVPWHIDVDSLPEVWDCAMNTWDPDSANCVISQDLYDPVKENTLNYSSPLVKQHQDIKDMKIGEWRDVFCLKNLVYYEAQIKKVKIAKNGKKDPPKILFHYKGWSNSFDEWIPYNSERIQVHNLFTNPDATDPRQQEQWQGRSPVKSTIRSAFINDRSSGKKRKVESELNCSAKSIL